MERNLIIHVNGPLSSDCTVYLTDDAEFVQWQRLGLIQSIKFEALADDVIPKLSVGLLGLSIDDVDTPKFIDGTIICLRNFSRINERVVKDNKLSGPVIIPDVIILEGKETTESSDISFYELHKPIGMIKRIVLEVDVKTNTSTLEIQKVEGF